MNESVNKSLADSKEQTVYKLLDLSHDREAIKLIHKGTRSSIQSEALKSFKFPLYVQVSKGESWNMELVGIPSWEPQREPRWEPRWQPKRPTI